MDRLGTPLTHQHCEMTGTPDMGKVFEALGALPEAARKEILQGVETKMTIAQETRTKEGLIAHFKRGRQGQFTSLGGKSERVADLKGLHAISTTQSSDVKPGGTTSVLSSNLSPLCIRDLAPGTTHRGRFLCGRVTCDAAYFGIASTILLLEDIFGDVVEIAIYGIPQASTSLVEKMFPLGMELVVLEPFYKVRADMTLGVRVDKPEEVQPWQLPRTLLDWKDMGNKFVRVGGCGAAADSSQTAALFCYDKALASFDRQRLALLMNNVATCRAKQGRALEAVRWAAMATAVDPEAFKAWYRLASALVDIAINREDSAAKASAWAAKQVLDWCQAKLTLTADCRRLFVELVVKLKREGEEIIESSLPTRVRRALGRSAWHCVPGVVCLVDADNGEEGRRLDMWSAGKQDKAAQDEQEGAIQQLRTRGSTQFQAQDYAGAVQSYLDALWGPLGGVLKDAAIIFSNMSAVHLTVDGDSSPGTEATSHSQDALFYAGVSALMDGTNAKAWHRQARVLERWGCSDDARTLLESVVNAAAGGSAGQGQDRFRPLLTALTKELQQLKERTHLQSKVVPISQTPTDQQLRERLDNHDVRTLFDRNSAAQDSSDGNEQDECSGNDETIDQYIARSESMMMMTEMTKSKKEMRDMFGPLLQRTCPQFHREFLKDRGMPEGLDRVFAEKVLYRAFLNSQSHPWMVAFTMRQGMFKLDEQGLFKRWHGLGALEAFLKAVENREAIPPGRVFDARHRCESKMYDRRIRSNFANSPNRPETMFQTRTHVAVGFNDLGSLLSATILEAKGEDHQPGCPMRFVGIEMSEFSVAKSWVVAQMLGDSRVPLDHVLQVWYSSSWSSAALSDFRTAVRQVLEKLEKTRGGGSGPLQFYNAKVVSYLSHWLSAEPLSVFGQAASFHRKQDRLALCQYCLTGEVFTSERAHLARAEGEAAEPQEDQEGGSSQKAKRMHKRKKKKQEVIAVEPEFAQVGSLTMWSVPAGSPPLEEDVMFNAVQFEDLIKEHESCEKMDPEVRRRMGSSLDVTDYFVLKILRDMERIRGLLTSGLLEIHLFQGVLRVIGDEGATEIADAIAELRPYTLSWSNVLDYFRLEEFHEVARRCSKHGDAMHYGYSMNWVAETYGTCVADYCEHEELRPTLNFVLDQSLGETAKRMAEFTGAARLVTVPFFDTPMNISSFFLAMGLRSNWLEHFWSKARDSVTRMRRSSSKNGRDGLTARNQGLTTGEDSMGMEFPLHRSGSSLYMSWTYDPNLRPQPLKPETDEEVAAVKAKMTELGLEV